MGYNELQRGNPRYYDDNCFFCKLIKTSWRPSISCVKFNLIYARKGALF